MGDLGGTRSIEISAPRERCFAIAADIDQAPAWHGAMTAVKVLERDEHGRARVVDSQFDASVTQLSLRLRFDYEPPTGIRWTREGGDLRSLDGSWQFEERGDGITLATYTLDIGVGGRLALLVRTVRGPVRNRVESLLADRPVEGLKARVENGG